MPEATERLQGVLDVTTLGFIEWARLAGLSVGDMVRELDRFTADVERALKITNWNHVIDLGVYVSTDPAVPPAVCSSLRSA